MLAIETTTLTNPIHNTPEHTRTRAWVPDSSKTTTHLWARNILPCRSDATSGQEWNNPTTPERPPWREIPPTPRHQSISNGPPPEATEEEETSTSSKQKTPKRATRKNLSGRVEAEIQPNGPTQNLIRVRSFREEGRWTTRYNFEGKRLYLSRDKYGRVRKMGVDKSKVEEVEIVQDQIEEGAQQILTPKTGGLVHKIWRAEGRKYGRPKPRWDCTTLKKERERERSKAKSRRLIAKENIEIGKLFRTNSKSRQSGR
ncbi:hypothetical protein FQA39_LY12473 [Lamprigera yunnana]|nr:hypothetical protein FQA39_LY12473 [Lamprigera yunnana]